MHEDIASYNATQEPEHRALCDLLVQQIDKHLPDAESRIWHGHPVWFLDDNPIETQGPAAEAQIAPLIHSLAGEAA